MTFTPDGAFVVTIGIDGEVRLWAADRNTLVAAHRASVGVDPTFSDDGQYMAVAEPFGGVTVRRTSEGRLRARFDPTLDVRGFYSPDGRRIVTKSRDGTLHLFDARDGKAIVHVDLVAPFAFSADGSRFGAMSLAHSSILILDSASGATLASVPDSSLVARIELSAGAQRVLVLADDKSLGVWNAFPARRLLSAHGETASSTMDESGMHLLAWTDRRHLQVWDLDRAVVTLTIEPKQCGGADGGIYVNSTSSRARTTADARRIAIAVSQNVGEDGVSFRDSVELFDGPSGRCLASIPFAGNVSFDRRGQTMSSMGEDFTLRVWNLEDGSLVRQLSANTEAAQGLESPDGAFIVSRNSSHSAVDLRSLIDGRLLLHIPLLPGEGGDAEVAFAAGADSLLISGVTLQEWRLDLEKRTPAEIGQIVTLRSPWRVVGSQLVLIEGGLEGSVVQKGAPMAEAIVSLHDANDQPLEPAFEQMTRTTADGTFTFGHVRPGPYDVELFSREGARLQSPQVRRVWVTPDMVQPLRISIE